MWWGSELPAHHTIISVVPIRLGSNPFVLLCNIWWMAEVFGVKSAVSSGPRVQPEQPSLPTLLPEDWRSSMHQRHQASRGTCSMPNQWFIRTQLAGRHGAPCHMPPGSTAICTHSPLLYSQLSLALYSLYLWHVRPVQYQRRAAVWSLLCNIKTSRRKRFSGSVSNHPASELEMSHNDLQLNSCCASWQRMKYSSI